MNRIPIIILIALAYTAPLYAEPFPETLTLSPADANGINDETTLSRNGHGRCVWGIFKWKLYDIALYVEQTSSDPNTLIPSNQVKRFEQVFLRKMKKAHVVHSYRCAFEGNAGDQAEALQERFNQLCQWIPTANKGDRLIFTMIPARGLDMRVNEKALGFIPGEDFNQLFMSLFLGPIPPTDEVKQGLLGM